MDIRKADMSDIDLLVRLRFDYLKETTTILSDVEQNSLTKHMLSYYEEHLCDDTFVAILAEENGVIASVAYLAISDMPASPSFPTGKIGTVLNVLTYPEFRRRGAASQVITRILSEARAQQVKTVRLSATEAGKPLYQKLGFINAINQAMTITLT